MLLYPSQYYRTFAYTIHLHVSSALPPLQNLCIHIPSPCFSTPATATEPLHTRFTTMFLPPSPSLQNLSTQKEPR